MEHVSAHVATPPRDGPTEPRGSRCRYFVSAVAVAPAPVCVTTAYAGRARSFKRVREAAFPTKEPPTPRLRGGKLRA